MDERKKNNKKFKTDIVYKHKNHCYDIYTTKGDGGKMESSKEPMVIQNQQKCVCFFLCF